jgi:flagellar basal-body rod modification protein FlgD
MIAGTNNVAANTFPLPVTAGTGATGASTSSGTGSLAALVSTIPGGGLGENSFLQLLVTQLEYQNPLAPTGNTQFVTQLAQFSSLEQMTNISSQEGQVVSGISQLSAAANLGQAYALLGDTVSLTAANGNAVSGTVSAVNTSGGQVNVVVAGQAYPLADLTSVSK